MRLLLCQCVLLNMAEEIQATGQKGAARIVYHHPRALQEDGGTGGHQSGYGETRHEQRRHTDNGRSGGHCPQI